MEEQAREQQNFNCPDKCLPLIEKENKEYI